MQHDGYCLVRYEHHRHPGRLLHQGYVEAQALKGRDQGYCSKPHERQVLNTVEENLDRGNFLVEPQRAALFSVERLNTVISKARDYILSLQNAEGYWVFDLEADCTIPAEYVLLQRFLGRPVPADLATGLSRYLRRRQLLKGGWPVFKDGVSDISASTKVYFALKLLGDSPEQPHMIDARRTILDLGGASRVNVFTRITLALFGQIPWRTVPAMPVEIMLLPSWFFFHVAKVSYWSRTVMIPLLILLNKKPICPLGPEEGVHELFVESPHEFVNLDHSVPGNGRKNLFIHLDRLLKRIDRFAPRVSREKALKKAISWMLERMQGKGGLGAIFPAMVNAVMALKTLGFPEDHPAFVRGTAALDDLLVRRGDEGFCQPCVSPVWDTCLSLSTLLEEGVRPEHQAVASSVGWLFQQQILCRGDWCERVPEIEPGGWAFQFENTFYPDVDDTPAVLMSILRAGCLGDDDFRDRIAKAVKWVLGMQSSDGGWGSFDIDNNCIYLNDIPFADHGALLDPSTADLTGRCVELLSMLGFDRDFPPIAKALRFLRREQEPCGAWFGRWGVNYIYGTWSVLMGLRQAGEDMTRPYIRRAAQWLESRQNPDNGWGESCYTYNDPSLAGIGKSTPSQTAWALLGLMAAGEHGSSTVQRGIQYLLNTQNPQGGWDEDLFTGTGFPRVFYLRYHGYSRYFPLWALAVYRRLRAGRKTRQDEVRLQGKCNLLEQESG
ncbi:MAG: squalene--hopene cyclase [Deltaproteobacteria bacterium HGW-Deltaproteobacteria-21]|nr:MAG: squalene--hopene cyclase [Deltaproteobacteria bacterium HGW-Deltaproteobacteria-21]